MTAVSDLADLATQSLTLPDFAPGGSYPQKLVAGRDAALAALRKYVPDLKYDPAAAEEIMAQVSVWEERNQAILQAAIKDPNVKTIPDQVAANLGADKARAFIVAMFTQAAAGLGPWTSGAVSIDVASGASVGGQPITRDWADVDALSRLHVFGAIVQMDKIGYLQTMFVSPAAGTQGFGIAFVVPIGWVITLGVVAVISLFAVLTYMYASRRLEANNKIMAEICKNAQVAGDQATVEHCVDATRDLQLAGMFPGLEQGINKLVTAALYLGVGYVGVFYILPAMFKRKR